jgi:uncharacterized protein (TIGR03437 family)
LTTFLLLAHGVAAAVPAGTLLSPAGSPFASGPVPVGMAMGDFNGDGRLDLAVVNFIVKGGTVTLLFGNGSGGFTPGGTVDVGDAPQGVVAADFNGDGRLDLAVVNYNSNNISVLLGDGRGAFSPAAGSPISVDSHRLVTVAVADFNRDGRADLVVGDLFGGVNVLLGNGTGAFTIAPGSPFATEFGVTSVAVADFNGDGKPDLAIARAHGAQIPGTGGPIQPVYQPSFAVAVMLGNGIGGFTAAPGSPLTVGEQPLWVTVADLNRDGKPDLAVANGAFDSVTVLLGNGVGGFTPSPASPFAVGRFPTGIAAGDLNGDGVPDLAIVTSSGVTVLLNNGAGTFTRPLGNPGNFGDAATAVVAADFNGDGRVDLAAVTTFGSLAGGVLVLLGAPTPTSIALSTTANNVLFGQTVSVRAQVGVDVPHFAAPAGTVTFQDGVTKLATVPLLGGVASYDIATVGLGAHLITATYSGDIRSNPSTSAVLPVAVNSRIQISGVANGASFQPGVVAPNTILSLFGSNLACGPNPQVLIGASAAEILAVTNSQINFVVPPGVPGGVVSVQVVCGADRSQPYLLSASAAAPAIFTVSANGVGQASVLNQDSGFNGPASPAARGDYISVYGTGCGIYTAPDSNGLLRLAQPVTVVFGDAQTSVQFAGAAPGYTAGLQQINVQIPADAPTGPAVQIRIAIGGANTPSGVTVAIK